MGLCPLEKPKSVSVLSNSWPFDNLLYRIKAVHLDGQYLSSRSRLFLIKPSFAKHLDKLPTRKSGRLTTLFLPALNCREGNTYFPCLFLLRPAYLPMQFLYLFLKLFHYHHPTLPCLSLCIISPHHSNKKYTANRFPLQRFWCPENFILLYFLVHL